MTGRTLMSATANEFDASECTMTLEQWKQAREAAKPKIQVEPRPKAVN